MKYLIYDERPFRFFLLCAFALLVGCAQLGLLAPESFTEKIVAAKAVRNEVVENTAVLINTKKLSSKDGENVLKAADTATEGIAVAQTLAAQDPTAAQAKLTATVTILTALQAYIAVHQKK